MIGKVVKGIGGFYFVKYEGKIIRGQGRGLLKRNNKLIKVGDNVEFQIRDDNECIITKVLKRKNEFIRPSIANIDRLIVTFSATDPQPNYLSVDKLCVISEYYNVPVNILITKIDLVDESQLNEIYDIYKDVYKTFKIDALSGIGLRELMKELKGNTVALAGPSGVGKSTVLNAIAPNKDIETGAISEKTKRGKHTTRHAEIFTLDGDTNIFDTPGFTSLEMPIMEIIELGSFFPEFSKHGKCKYSDCIHINEPECAIKDALKLKSINISRYKSYIKMIEEINNNRRY